MNDFDINFVVRGDKVKAVYRQSEVPEYYNNPMIESLPPVWTKDEATAEISYYPPYHEDMRNSPDHIRHHLIQNSLRFFSALDVHIDLERRFSCLIRLGYADRNPSKGEFWKDINQRISSVGKSNRNQYERTRRYYSTSASGFYIVGISGIGKSQTIEQILRTYPQVIYHAEYQKRKFTYIQLVWLKLDCPFDGSIRGLCYNFFQIIDDLLGTNYFAEFAEKARNVDEMIPSMARVAANHCIGVLVIDEIQRLSRAKSGGAETMLNFFVQLVNTIGIPVVLVGTYKALPILQDAISLMRRGTGQGDLVWDRMQYDDQWQLLMEDLWDYQYIKNICSLKKNPHLSEVLYEECQGIVDLVIKLFMFAQERAITSGEERLTSSIIRSAAKDKFNLLQPALKAFKNKEKENLAVFEDAYPKFLKVPLLEKSNQPEIRGVISDEPEIKILLNPKTEPDTGTYSDDETYLQNEKQLSETQMAIDNFFQPKSSKLKNLSKKQEAQGILLSIFKSIESPNSKKIYDALRKSDFIKSGSEFLSDKEIGL